MTWAAYWKAIRHWWIVILLSTFAAGAVVWFTTPANLDTSKQINSYTATTTLIVTQKAIPTPTGTPTAAPAQAAPRVNLSRLALFITAGEIPVRAATALGYTQDPALLAASISVTVDESAGAITIAATSTDGQVAADRANAFGRETVKYFAKSKEIAGYSLRILQAAIPIPDTPGGGVTLPPTRSGRVALAASVGFLIGLALALILEFIFARVRTRAEISRVMGLPVVAEVPKLSRSERGKPRLMVQQAPLSPYADAYRSLRSAILHTKSVGEGDEWSQSRRPAGRSGRVILVTSSFAGEGKTTSAANLAASFAETGQRVLALDADLRSPDLHRKFDVPEGSGISDYVSSDTGSHLDGLVRPTKVPNVRMVTAGNRLDHPESLSSRLGPLIKEARKLAQVTIIDTAPMLAASDVFDVLPLVDSVVLVVRSGRLTEAHAERAAELLRRFSTPVTGVALIGAPKSRGGSYGTGYGTGKSSKGSRRKASEAPTQVVEPGEFIHPDDAWASASEASPQNRTAPALSTTESAEPRRANLPVD